MNFRVVWNEKSHEIDESRRRSRSSIEKPEGVSVIRRFTIFAMPLVLAAAAAVPSHAQNVPGAVPGPQAPSTSGSTSPAAPLAPNIGLIVGSHIERKIWESKKC